MSVQNGSAAAGEGVVQERPAAGGIYASLFEKINLTPVAALSALDTWQDAQAMAAPPLGDGPFWLGMNGVLGVERDNLPDDIPQTFTTELGYYTGLQPATPQQGNRHVTYTFD